VLPVTLSLATSAWVRRLE